MILSYSKQFKILLENGCFVKVFRSIVPILARGLLESIKQAGIRHDLLLDPLNGLHLQIFLYFHLFLHRLKIRDVLDGVERHVQQRTQLVQHRFQVRIKIEPVAALHIRTLVRENVGLLEPLVRLEEMISSDCASCAMEGERCECGSLFFFSPVV